MRAQIVKKYAKPILITYGKVTELTASGSAGNNENGGAADQTIRIRP